MPARLVPSCGLGVHAAITLLLTIAAAGGCSRGPATPEDPSPAGGGLLAKGFDAWTYELDKPSAKLQDVWTLRDGVLACSGRPFGFLRTKADHADYELSLEWRWGDSSAEPAKLKSGVLVHIGRPKASGRWPQSYEVQLNAGKAGDLITNGATLAVADGAAPVDDRIYPRRAGVQEKPPGEWNRLKVICRNDTITVYVNGQLAHRATDCELTRGPIGLQSEGAEIHFRNLKLTPLAGSE